MKDMEMDLFQPTSELCSVFTTIDLRGDITTWLELDGLDYDLEYLGKLDRSSSSSI